MIERDRKKFEAEMFGPDENKEFLFNIADVREAISNYTPKKDESEAIIIAEYQKYLEELKSKQQSSEKTTTSPTLQVVELVTGENREETHPYKEENDTIDR